MSGLGNPVSGAINSNYIFLQEENLTFSRKILLPRSSYPLIIKFLRDIAIDSGNTEPLKRIDNVIKRWSIIRLLLIGSKDKNSVLSTLPCDLIRHIRSYVDDKYLIVQSETESKLQRQVSSSKKRKSEQAENEQNKKK